MALYYLQKFSLKGIFGYVKQIMYYDRFSETVFQNVGCDGTDISKDCPTHKQVKSWSELYTRTRFFSPEMLGVIRGADNAPMQVIKGCLQYS